MSDWRIQRHYGFGAARVSLSPRPHRYNQSIGSAMREAGGDFYLSSLPPMILAVFMIAALFLTVSEDRGYTDVEVVMIGSELQAAPEEIEEPVQEIVEVPPEPEPVPEPVKKVEPPKPPPVQQIAKLRPPPPPAPPKPRPRPEARPKPAPKPRLEMAKLAPLPAAAQPAPSARSRRPAPQSEKPRIDLVPAIAPAPALALRDVPEPERPERFAAVRQPPPGRRPKADLGPPIAARAMTAPDPEPQSARSRRPAARPRDDAPRRVAPIDFAAAAAPAPAAPALHSPDRRSRPVPKPDSPGRGVPRPDVAPALPAPASMARAVTDAPRPGRSERERTPPPGGTRERVDRSAGSGLRGVPLASLAACLSDREEDALKRRLVAAVETQRECVSAAGTYRFVETKNLNAFLMTIERAPGRSVADRCVELSHALDCVGR